jgi:hypothetical protein
MTHISDSRVIGNHADMGEPLPAASRKSLTVTEIVRRGVSRRTRRREMGAAQSALDSEGGAAEREATNGEGGSVPGGAEGLPHTPTRLSR